MNEFRGFEKFCEGRMFYEMPLITERICGICPVSHHLVSAKACDAILGVEPPRPAQLLRELMHMGQTIQSHSMHFFELAGPDLILGFDADPAIRNVVGLYQADPKLTVKAIALRKFGQEIIAVPGRTARASEFRRARRRDEGSGRRRPRRHSGRLDTMIGYAQEGLGPHESLDGETREGNGNASRRSPPATSAWSRKTTPWRCTTASCGWWMRSAKRIERFDGRQYLDFIAEHVEDWSYLKFPYYRKLGWPGGAYRVGPLGRLNAAEKMSTPLAQREFELFRKLRKGKTVEGSLYYHYARLIENLYAIEHARQLLEDPAILSTEIRTNAMPTNREGVGVIEAPRGTLWHHYWVDEHGKLEKVNLIVATGNNNYAMSRAVEEVARQYVHGDTVKEGALNRVEAAIRAYDPCLSCSTHAVGQMPIVVEIVSADGSVLKQIARSPALNSTV